jgi:hypothetical protein
MWRATLVLAFVNQAGMVLNPEQVRALDLVRAPAHLARVRVPAPVQVPALVPLQVPARPQVRARLPVLVLVPRPVPARPQVRVRLPVLVLVPRPVLARQRVRVPDQVRDPALTPGPTRTTTMMTILPNAANASPALAALTLC